MSDALSIKDLHVSVEGQAILKGINLEIGAGLGALAGKVWRIGLMGFSSRAENIILCLERLKPYFRT